MSYHPIYDIKHPTKADMFKYLDEVGMPYRKIAIAGFQQNIITEEITKDIPKQTIELIAPFGLTSTELNELYLEYICEMTSYKVDDIYDLLGLKSINNKPFILELEKDLSGSFLYLPFKNIPASLFLNGHYSNKNNAIEIKSLGNIETVNGNLGISHLYLEDFGKLKQVNGDFWFSNSDLKLSEQNVKKLSLSPLKKVKGSVSIRGTRLNSLGSLSHVGKNLSLRFSEVSDLGSLEYVGGNLLVSKYNLEHYDFSKITVQGKIKKYNDKPTNENF